MSTTTSSPLSAISKQRDMHVAVVRTLWNNHITEALNDGALSEFKKAGLEDNDIDTFTVPGAVELTFAASKLIETGLYNAIVVLGCVIRGGTPHFDYVCQSVTQGITHLNSECDIPVIFGVLTVDNEQDALDRAGGCLGNKGAEAAQAALLMYDFNETVDNL
ncbi:MAG: 6,7-dimethyl-8-ribityllumazine synthase [Muribaculaceae bacterium]|nr:6,7-dimethyl-8-ribityllumazine synthase [Muribaculaceae bacterium]